MRGWQAQLARLDNSEIYVLFFLRLGWFPLFHALVAFDSFRLDRHFIAVHRVTDSDVPTVGILPDRTDDPFQPTAVPDVELDSCLRLSFARLVVRTEIEIGFDRNLKILPIANGVKKGNGCTVRSHGGASEASRKGTADQPSVAASGNCW
jgi:hypothetical protein